MMKLLDLVPDYVWLGLILAVTVFAIGERVELQGEQAAHATTKTEFATYQANIANRENVRAQFAQQEEARQRALEQDRNTAMLEAQNALHQEQKRSAAARADFDRRDRSLRDEIARYAAAGASGGASGGNPGAVPGAGERAANLGDLLATCRAEGREDAAELEGLAGQVRGLLTAYRALSVAPRSTSESRAD